MRTLESKTHQLPTKRIIDYGGVKSVCFSPDGRRLASGSEDRTVRLWDGETGACDRTLEAHGDPEMSVCFSTDGTVWLWLVMHQ